MISDLEKAMANDDIDEDDDDHAEGGDVGGDDDGGDGDGEDKEAFEPVDLSLEWKTKGNAMLSQGLLNEAIDCYTQSIHFDPKQQASYLNRSVAYLKKKKIRKSDRRLWHCPARPQLPPRSQNESTV